MALYQPSYMNPRNSTIDATIKEQMVFSCQLNGNSMLYGYDIKAYYADTNELAFQLTSDESKKILETELVNENTNLDNIKNGISTRENLLVELADDDADDNFQDSLNNTNTDCTEKLAQMNECIIGIRPTNEFFKIGDEIIKEVEKCRAEATTMKSRIETHYLVVLKTYQKRLENNRIQLDTNISRYNSYKAANQIDRQTINLLRRILDYVVANVSTEDSSTKRIIIEYWNKILPTLQDSIDDLRDSQKQSEAQIKYLETAINNLSKGMFVLSEPLYPVDYLGNNTVLQHQLPVGIFTNGKDYKWTITLFWSSTEKKGDPEQLEEFRKQLEQAKTDLNNVTLNEESVTTLQTTYNSDQAWSNLDKSLTTFKTNANSNISKMKAFISGTGEGDFWKLGDSIVTEANTCITQAQNVKNRIETYYKIVSADYQKRFNNNSTLLQSSISSYQEQKKTGKITSAAISPLQSLMEYMTSLKSTDNYSTKTITNEYWLNVATELKSQLSVLETKKTELEDTVIHLETTIQNDGLDMSITSQEAYFECRTMPTIQIDNFIPIINKKYYEFTGKYTQNENVPVTYFRWVLTQVTTGEVLKDTGLIPSTDLRFYYDGFLNDYQYTIQLFVQNQNNIQVQTDALKFKVSYVGLIVDNVVTATPNTEEHGIIVEWSGIHGITGTIYGQYEYLKDMPVITHNSLELPKGSSLVFDKDNDDTLKVPATTASHIISIRIDSPDIETIYEATGSNGGLPYYKRLTLDGNDLVYDINGVKQIKHTIIPSKLYWYVIFMLPDKLIVSQKWADGLFPAADLYPHVGLYPKPLTYHNTEGEVII